MFKSVFRIYSVVIGFLVNIPSVVWSLILHTLVVMILIAIFNFSAFHSQTIMFNLYNQGGIHVNVVNSPKASNRQRSHHIVSVDKSTYILHLKNQPNTSNNDLNHNPIANNQHQLDYTSTQTTMAVNTGTGGNYKNAKVISVNRNNNLLKYNIPSYPERAIALSQEGEVIVRLLVNKNNQIIDYVLYKSSGYEILDHAVMNVVNTWQLKQLINQTAWLQVKINFTIN